jgi:hypothetical protein
MSMVDVELPMLLMGPMRAEVAEEAAPKPAMPN